MKDREEIFNSNIRIAYKIANEYKNCGIEFENLKQMALLALWKSVLTFNAEKGFAFSTYAYRVIKNQINMYLRANRKYFTDRYFSEEIGESITLEDVLADTHDYIDEVERNLEIKQQIDELNNMNLKPKERQVLELTLKGKKQQDVADLVGTSQTQVSRILKKVKNKCKRGREIIAENINN